MKDTMCLSLLIKQTKLCFADRTMKIDKADAILGITKEFSGAVKIKQEVLVFIDLGNMLN